MIKQTDWRKICAELIEDLSYLVECCDSDNCDPVALKECRQHLRQTRDALSQPEPGVVGPSDEALAAFTEWFCRNYPGPDTIIHKPTWHAPRVFRAAVDALTRYATPQPSPVPAPMSADTLAAIIREVDGTHRLGAAALAEAILAHPAAINTQPVPGAEVPPMPVPGDAEGLAEVFWGRYAQPEPEGVTNEELGAFFVEKGLLYATEGTYALASVTRNVHGQVLARAFREALARWGRPAIEPVPVAERPWEREGWCDAEGRCWLHRPAKIPCRLANGTLYRWVLDTPCRDEEEPVHDTHCLPHHALPIPATH
jgi:hypothetical protein